MESLYLLIPLSILIAFGIGIAFWWSIRNGQFDDLEGPSWRILQDNDTPSSQTQHNTPSEEKNPD